MFFEVQQHNIFQSICLTLSSDFS